MKIVFFVVFIYETVKSFEGTFDIGAFDNKVICECHIAHPGYTMKSCFWHIPHGIPGHDDYMCGKPLIDTIFAQVNTILSFK